MISDSDDTGPVHPDVLTLFSEANQGHTMPYGADLLMDEVRTRLREIFEAPDAAVYLVATGTTADNALALATLGKPWQTVFCTPVAHIHEDECNAPEFYTGGARLTFVGDGDKLTPDTIRASIAAQEVREVRGPQRGTVYTGDEIATLTDVARV